MKVSEIKRIVKNARKDPRVLLSEEYIEAQLHRFSLTELTTQMGPNCNRRCGHCYGDYGPHRQGLPDARIVEKALGDALEGRVINRQTLSDGEPLRAENREVMEVIARHSDELSTIIITNGSFARTWENTRDWMRFLKDKGFNLGRKRNRLCVSAGRVYDISFGNYRRIMDCLQEVYSGIDFGKHFHFQFIGTNKPEEENKLYWELVREVGRAFKTKKGMSRRNKKEKLFTFFVYPENLSPIKIQNILAEPDGRAKNLPMFVKLPYSENLSPHDLYFYPDFRCSLWLGYDGAVGFGPGECSRVGRIYGNVKEEHLMDIASRIQKDSVYQAFKLGGVRFLAYQAKQVGDFNIRGQWKCDVCHDLFANYDLVEGIRQNLNREGVVKSYKSFINQLDFGRKTVL